ncbi:transketolase [Candidatus Uhrbacteria bacterium RIFCSPHIGHO2_12_FULL_60_25]|uniref:Transketolase n=1 Tax=Candidatus Uhrbacteria bacterium RIFCSPHIGHO2_12_FULL_60_25 TaxID=1802399 RepID=A0A1F7UJJ1_9BACT|nr:MAG: transketolase [Candidatus Uhrbacteria bacterium RIFCSPHIGHO2_02_FULL_60_44]OGL78415.1 MAG: transketolase [Candidatus Uhrbacteria bacterium RIFCSPHIGHO2_12_FULL_60_25]
MPHLHEEKVKNLELIANKLRQHVIRMVAAAGSGHQGGALGMADVFAVLYFHELKHRPKDPEWEDRDRLILSNGHICPVRYAAMAEAGYFPVKELMTLRRLGSRLQGHPERERLPGSETTSGPLGSGLGQATGMAYVGKMDKKSWRVFCLTSDAEHEAGVHWEATMFAGKNRLDNLTCVIDRNNIQIDGDTENVMPLEPLRAKYEAFNWHVIECNGNDVQDVTRALEEAKKVHDRPTVVIAHTIPGRGVSYMENNYLWHSQPFKPGEAEKALKELKDIEAKLTADHQQDV